MKVLVTPERRERPSRAAAPKDMTELYGSDGESSDISFLDVPPSSPAPAAPIADDKVEYEHSSSDSVTSIPAITNKAVTLTAVNQHSSPNKRAFNENEGGSPTKKPRKLILKASNKKPTEDDDASAQTATPVQALTPLPSQTVSLSQLTSGDNFADLQTLQQILKSIQGRVTNTIQVAQVGLDLEQAKEKITSLEQQLQASLSSQDSQLELKQYKEKLHRTLQSEINLRKENDDLKKERDNLKAFNTELRIDIAEVLDEREQHLNDSFKITDDQVDIEWRGIGFDIRNFVSQVCTVEPYRLSAPRGANHKEVEALKKNQKKEPELARFYFQQYIWKRLVRDVFQAEAGAWGGPAGQAFHRFCLDLSEVDFQGMRELSRIKAHTADFLSKHSNAENSTEAKKLTLSMKDDLYIFMDSDKADGAAKQLWDIVRRAVALNTNFLKSRAFFVTSWLSDDINQMDKMDVQWARGDTSGDAEVEIEISPTLSKIGNADGRYFDKDAAMVICKPMVTVINV